MENRKKKFDQDTLDRGKRRKEEAEKQKAEEARRQQHRARQGIDGDEPAVSSRNGERRNFRFSGIPGRRNPKARRQSRTIKILKDWNVINILREPGSSVL